MNTVRCVSLVGDRASLVEPRYLWVHLCWTCRVSRFTHFSIFWFVVSALCVCDELNFHNCTKFVHMLRSRVEILLNVEPHQGTRMEFQCASTF